MCHIRARLAAVGPVLTRLERGPGHGSDRIGDGALPLARGVQVDESSPSAAVAHTVHQFPEPSARIGCELNACFTVGLPQSRGSLVELTAIDTNTGPQE
jgi:hypothetical protein